MKIVIIGNDLRAYWKGRISYLKSFLNQKQIDLFAIELFGEGSPYDFDSAAITSVWWQCLFPGQRSDELPKQRIKKRLFSVLDEIKPDVIISSAIVFYAGALGIQWAKKNKSRFIMFDDMKPFQVKRSKITQFVKDTITNQIDGFWVPTAHYYDDYAQLHDKNITFFYGLNCIDNEIFKPREAKTLDHKIIVCVARLVPVKNLSSLFKAWKLVEEINGAYKLIVIGNGEEYKSLVELKNELKLNNVELTGALDNNIIANYYFNADAFVLSSLTESWGLVVNEAMAAKLPVLLSNTINSTESLLKEGINGFSFNPLNIEEMAKVMLKFIESDESLKKNMSDNSGRIIEAMNYEYMGNELFKAVMQICNQPYKKSIFSSVVINLWFGKNNTSGWSKMNSN